MDAHYDQVMRARAAAGDAPRRYFGYSTVLDREAFLAWKGQHGYDFFELPQGELAEARDVDLIFDFPSRFWGGRVLGLTDAPGQRVHGLLYAIAGKDWPVIQHKEGAITNMCVERELEVSVGGQLVTATAFVTSPQRRSTDGPVSARFVEALLRGARASNLPADYLARLERTARGSL